MNKVIDVEVMTVTKRTVNNDYYGQRYYEDVYDIKRYQVTVNMEWCYMMTTLMRYEPSDKDSPELFVLHFINGQKYYVDPKYYQPVKQIFDNMSREHNIEDYKWLDKSQQKSIKKV